MVAMQEQRLRPYTDKWKRRMPQGLALRMPQRLPRRRLPMSEATMLVAVALVRGLGEVLLYPKGAHPRLPSPRCALSGTQHLHCWYEKKSTFRN